MHKSAYAIGEKIEQSKFYSTLGNFILEESDHTVTVPLAVCSQLCTVLYVIGLMVTASQPLSALRDHLSVTQYLPLSTDTDCETVTCSSLCCSTVPRCLSQQDGM